MIPYESKIDKNGLLYIDNDYIKEYPIKQLNLSNDTIVNSYFYEFLSTNDYILKYKLFPYNKHKLMNMLIKLQEIKENVKNIDFPIGYYLEDNEIMGQIIKYYQNAPSLYNLCKTNDINIISKYYYHDDNNIHNLYMLFLDILNIIEELVENNVYYTDIHMGNFVIFNNQVKLIDFDYQLIHFYNTKNNDLIKTILTNYDSLVYIVNKKLNLYELSSHEISDFREMKAYVKKIENQVRRNR